ncbi:hypothetical protein SAMN06295912_106132 [Sphingomonas laterariae]|uniref:Membrane-anchored ribosome-binding protein, inhibits growth in stationary phase, ElaB/YqjD/DUF883 family n=1 Tax=Edaphosphingomonas laterariae TaxID=861865 RepID=A0A239EIP4_9SPHN|nr:hypothetical protein [Sphingomonas laterariae]SNS43772.1 hypothetical protein SAMN06295912_106132 [Sphingomonas laterariae]
MSNSVKDSAERASAFASEKLAEAKQTLRDRSQATRAAAHDALESARGKVDEAKSATAQGIEDNPVAALVAGLALGAIVGALLPRGEREKEALGTVGGKLNEAARTAYAAAKDAGREAMEELGINKDAAQAQVDKFVQAATKSASAAGNAAMGTVKNR